VLATHRDIVGRMTDRYRADPEVVALIVIGSVARGDASPHSDVDAVVILKDEAFARRYPSGLSPLRPRNSPGSPATRSTPSPGRRASSEPLLSAALSRPASLSSTP
jgi:hypothetical protein